MKTGGVRFDFYDDPSGELVKKAWATPQELPSLVKTAHILNQEERSVLRDEAFALVMDNGGSILRKFACVDPGNTLLSMLYFKDSQEMLPEEAKSSTAVKLAAACERFDLKVPEFIKKAAKNYSRTRDSMQRPMVGDEADWSSRTNLVSIQGSGVDSGKVVPTANQMKTASEKSEKSKDEYTGYYGNAGGHIQAHPDGSAILTIGPPEHWPKARQFNMHMYKKPDKNTKTSVGKKYKLASVGPIGKGETLTNDKRTYGPSSKQPNLQKTTADRAELMVKKAGEYTDRLRQMSSAPVRVTDEVPVLVFEKKASVHTALQGRFPLDSYGQVQKAVSYFDENYQEFDPEDRREYAVKTASRADEVGISYSDVLGRYGSMGYSPDVDGHIHKRMHFAGDDWSPVYEHLMEKKASVPPDVFANLLGEIDVEAGLVSHYDGEIKDPFFSTFGGRVSREKRASWGWTGTMGDTVSGDQLNTLAQNRDSLQSTFGPEIVNAFTKDPIVIFESLPDDTKTILARMANK